MRLLGIVLLLLTVMHADELEMFDVVDTENNTSQEISNTDFNARIKLSYLAQDNSRNNAVLFADMSDHKKHYVYDLRLVVDGDVYDVYVKDLYYKTELGSAYFLELGRMNVKEGVARGYNPTDYFRGGSALTLSVDPKERKDNRLGAVLVQGTYIAEDYTIKALYAPEISVDESSIWGNKKHFGLKLHETNKQERATLYAGYTGLDDWSLSALVHHDDDGIHLGTNISYIYERAIWYMEASVNKRAEQIIEALDTLHATNALMANFSTDTDYQTELSLGLNYTFENSVVGTFEYIYNSAGFDSHDWKTYFTLMQTSTKYTPMLGKARGVIANNAQRMSKHTLFAMARKSDALPNLDWVVMAWVNPVDRSTLLQVGTSYDCEDMVFSADIRSYIGKAQSEYGSMSNDFEALLSVEYFF